jgi:ATP-binding cassette subfamily F protein 3
MNLVKFSAVTKEFSGTPLFTNVSFELQSFEKVALIGANGTGKSTIVKMILGESPYDAGDVFVNKTVRIGYLSQSILEDDAMSVIAVMQEVFSGVMAIGKQLEDLTSAMETDHSESLLSRYSQLEDDYLRLGGYEIPTKIDFVLSRFGFSKDDYARAVGTFSGGERTRIAFAKLLLEQPELLILDEPTNHMDIEIIEWLEDYLKKYPGAVFIVTHDKYFINRVVTKLFELDRGTLSVYYGNYDFYEEEKVRRYEALLKSYNRQAKEIAHLQSFVDRFRYKATKAKSAQDRIKKIARIERIERPSDAKDTVHFRFKSRRPTDAVILKTHRLQIGYDKPLQPPLEIQMRGYEKIGIIGPNGIGKTTFIKTIMGSLNPLSGDFKFLKEYKIGYFDQNVATLDTTQSVIESVHSRYPMKSTLEVRNLLARFLFTEEDVFKEVAVLSGGEKVRLALCLLMLEEPDFLILDEPTNHLDIDTKNVVEDVFEDWEGPMLFISHDRYFINRVANRIFHFEPSGVTVFDGNYDDYKTERDARLAEAKTEKPVRERVRKTVVDPGKIEKKIDQIHAKIEELKASLFDESVYGDPEVYRQTETEIAKLTEEEHVLWEQWSE